MKFAEHLGAHITPEWRKQYIQYEMLKDLLYAAQDEAPNADAVDDDHVQRFLANFEERFFRKSDQELVKINTFFSEKLAEAHRKWANLKSELGELEERDRNHVSGHQRRKLSSVVQRAKNKKETAVRNLPQLKLAFSEFYLSLILLQNYQQLNFTGFRKILKKHDKLMQTETGSQWKSVNVASAHFYINKDIDRLIQETENVVTTKLEGGNRAKAMKRLRVPPLGDQETPWTTFRVGLFSGIVLVLSISIVLSALFVEVPTDWRPALRMYRGAFLVVLFCFLLSVNTYGWRSSGVNHVLIFELDPRDNLDHQQLSEVASFLMMVWCLSGLSYMYGDIIMIKSLVQPLVLILFMITFLLNPFKCFYHSARFWLLRVIWRIVTAPFHHVGFADFWLADQLNSLTAVIIDMQYFVCFYAFSFDWSSFTASGSTEFKSDVCMSNIYGLRPLISCLPAWWRFVQCLRRYRDTRLAFPHLANAGKYSTTFFVVLFSSLHKWQKEKPGHSADEYTGFFYIYVVACVISFCYTFAWDIRMDWGLLDKNAGENRFLREEVVYAYKSYYYFAVIEDLILRLSWTTHLVNWHLVDEDVLMTLLALLEVSRRFIWNFFRLENEHLNNCGQFRAVRDISVAPLSTNDLYMILHMMDEPDGVVHRRKNRLKNKTVAHYMRRYTASEIDRFGKSLKKADTKLWLLDAES